MSMWKKVMLQLGLAPDEEYDEYDATMPEPAGPVAAPGVSGYAGGDDVGATRVIGEVDDLAAEPMNLPSGVEVTPMATPADVGQSRPRSTVVRPIPSPAMAKPFIVNPNSFNDAQEVADKFRSKLPVIVNLQDAEQDLSRRLIDFSSGLCYGLGGQMEKVAKQVYLLTPDEVEVSVEDRRQLRERGLLAE